MRLKGTSIPKKSEPKTQKIQTEQQKAEKEIERLKAEMCQAQQALQVLDDQISSLSIKRNDWANKQYELRRELSKQEAYVADLTNELIPGRWYIFGRYYRDPEAKPLVYITDIRRPRKYAYVSFFYVIPKTDWNPQHQDVIVKDVFYATHAEARHNQLASCLKEETEQNRMALLMRWGIAESKLLDALHRAFDDLDKPYRLTSNDYVESELDGYYKSRVKKKVLDFTGSQVQIGDKND